MRLVCVVFGLMGLRAALWCGRSLPFFRDSQMMSLRIASGPCNYHQCPTYGSVVCVCVLETDEWHAWLWIRQVLFSLYKRDRGGRIRRRGSEKYRGRQGWLCVCGCVCVCVYACESVWHERLILSCMLFPAPHKKQWVAKRRQILFCWVKSFALTF